MSIGWTIDRADVFVSSAGTPRYEQIASAVEAAIERGDLRPGDRLPTVRALARQLGVSSASVAVAYRLLERHGRADAYVGRGTFVRAAASNSGQPVGQSSYDVRDVPRRVEVSPAALVPSWRRRSLNFGDRLRAMNPHALVCINAWPDPQHLPLALLKDAYASAIANLAPHDLQYTGPDAQPQLIEALLPRLARDGLVATEHDVLVVNSYIQALALTLQVAPTLVGSNELLVAVEEPGYPASFNLVESLGHRLIAVDTDAHGALPTSIEAALDRGATVVVLTPRALNPTGASWTVERRERLADVLGQFPRVLIVEDDHFSGLASGSPGSLVQDQQLGERTVHVRSFSKSLAPDLRETVVIARGRLRKLVRDAKINNGGWTSKINQRALAAALAHPALDGALEAARSAYAQRRAALTENLLAHMPDADISLPTDGLNVWMRLPHGCDALDVVQNAAHLGVLISSGEGFYLHMGRRDAVRISIGHVTTADARRAGELVAQAVLTVDDQVLPLVV